MLLFSSAVTIGSNHVVHIQSQTLTEMHKVITEIRMSIKDSGHDGYQDLTVG